MKTCLDQKHNRLRTATNKKSLWHLRETNITGEVYKKTNFWVVAQKPLLHIAGKIQILMGIITAMFLY